MEYKCDYHIHSYFSDGTMKPTEIVKMYKEKGYDLIALTDHDGVDGVKEAMIAGEALELKVIPGVELAVSYAGNKGETELHLLGYHIDIENPQLTERLADIRAARAKRNEKLLALLQEKGFELSQEDLQERPGQTYVGKPNFARALERKGYILPDMWDVFDSIEKEKITAEEGIKLISGAGGIAVLAHPMKIKHMGKEDGEFWDSLEEAIRQLKKTGLKGLECYHPSADEGDSLRLVNLAAKYHLHITEGSDFHGI